MAALRPETERALKWLDSDGSRVLASFKVFPPDADDLLQDARLILLRKQDEWNLRDWKPLLYATLVNLAKTFKKRRRLASLDPSSIPDTTGTEDVLTSEAELLSHNTVLDVLEMILDFMPGGDAIAARGSLRQSGRGTAAERAQKSRFWSKAKDRLTADDVSILAAIQANLNGLELPAKPNRDDRCLQRALRSCFSGHLAPDPVQDLDRALTNFLSPDADDGDDENDDYFLGNDHPLAQLALALKRLRVRGAQGEVVSGCCFILMAQCAKTPEQRLKNLRFAMFALEDGFRMSRDGGEYTAAISLLLFMFCVYLTIMVCTYDDVEDGFDERIAGLMDRAEKMAEASQRLAVVHYAARLRLMLMAGAIDDAWNLLRDDAARTALMVGFLRPSGWQIMEAMTDRE